jgi:hypothetical protein
MAFGQSPSFPYLPSISFRNFCLAGFLNNQRSVFFKNSDGGFIREHSDYYRDRLAETIKGIRVVGKEAILVKQVPLFRSIDACLGVPSEEVVVRGTAL